MSGFYLFQARSVGKGIKQLDVVCITGDAYVDHPNFGIAIISRLIEAEGFSVGLSLSLIGIKLRTFKDWASPAWDFLLLAETLIPW